LACIERCSLWQVYLHVFVMVTPKFKFSLCVVFFVALWVLVGHLSLQRYLRLLALIRPVAAALQLYIIHLYNKNFFAYIYRTLYPALIQQ
jgi:hypothetical protein